MFQAALFSLAIAYIYIYTYRSLSLILRFNRDGQGRLVSVIDVPKLIGLSVRLKGDDLQLLPPEMEIRLEGPDGTHNCDIK